MDSTNPGSMKQLGNGRVIKGFRSDVWLKQKEDVMRLACEAKFRQNRPLWKALQETEDTVIAEACFDLFWGIGWTLDSPEAVVPSKWKGKNTMGKILTHLRQVLG